MEGRGQETENVGWHQTLLRSRAACFRGNGDEIKEKKTQKTGYAWRTFGITVGDFPTQIDKTVQPPLNWKLALL